mgnify:CR=1 FL=1
MMKRGITIIELLVAIVILLVLGAGIYTAYINLIRNAISRSLVAKQEQDVNALVFQLKKDISSIGFGIEKAYLRPYGADGTIACNNLNTFANSNSSIARCLQDTNREELYFLSLAGRQEGNAGCWWYVDASGGLNSFSKSYTLQNCPASPPTDRTCLITNAVKQRLYLGNCPNSFTNYTNSFVFYVGSGSYSSNYAFRYYADSTSLPPECAPGTYNLRKQANGDVPQPVISCVGAFRVRFFDGNNYATTLTDINNLKAIRLCLLLQVGGRTTTLMDVPSFSSHCGGTIATNPEWRWYRWAVIEELIPLENIR